MLYLILHSMDECVTCRKALRGLWTFSLQKSRDRSRRPFGGGVPGGSCPRPLGQAPGPPSPLSWVPGEEGQGDPLKLQVTASRCSPGILNSLCHLWGALGIKSSPCSLQNTRVYKRFRIKNTLRFIEYSGFENTFWRFQKHFRIKHSPRFRKQFEMYKALWD